MKHSRFFAAFALTLGLAACERSPEPDPAVMSVEVRKVAAGVSLDCGLGQTRLRTCRLQVLGKPETFGILESSQVVQPTVGFHFFEGASDPELRVSCLIGNEAKERSGKLQLDDLPPASVHERTSWLRRFDSLRGGAANDALSSRRFRFDLDCGGESHSDVRVATGSREFQDLVADARSYVEDGLLPRETAFRGIFGGVSTADQPYSIVYLDNALAARMAEEQKALTLSRSAFDGDILGRDAACVGFPRPKDDQIAIAFVSYTGAAVSNAVVGPGEHRTKVSWLHVEDGDKPLFVALFSRDPIIWIFDGATDRISKVVVAAPYTAAPVGRVPEGERSYSGTYGVDADKVAFMSTTCVSRFAGNLTSGYLIDQQRVVSGLGRVDYLAGIYSADQTWIPSGRVITSFDKGQRRMTTQSRYGTVDIDPVYVVGPVPARKSEPSVPAETLSELVLRRKVTHLGSGRFRINEQIQLPKDGFAEFVLPDGVPPPKGTGCVTNQQGIMLEGSVCRGINQ